jgi:HSP20 family protein
MLSGPPRALGTPSEAQRMFEFQRPWIGNLDQLQREMERYLDHIQRRKPPSVIFSQRAWQPSADVYETREAVVAVFELAGVPESDIHLVVARDSVTVQGERKDIAQSSERIYSVLEIPFGPFERTVPLPVSVNPEAASAAYRAGFLEVTMPKLSALKPQRVAVSER